MGYLRTSIDEHIRRDISRKVRASEGFQLCPCLFSAVLCKNAAALLLQASIEQSSVHAYAQVSELAERYAPSPAWFINVVSEVS